MYFIKKVLLGPMAKDKIEISEDTFISVKDSKRFLVAMLEIEEALDSLVENYVELEECLISLTLRYAIFHDLGFINFSIQRNNVNRKFSNLLSSARAFLDRLSAFAKRQLGEDALAFVASLTHEAYDGSLAYQFLEKLRNHTQHQGQGIHSLSYSSKWVNTGQGDAIRSVSLFFADYQEVLRSKNFSKTFLSKIPNDNGKIDLKPFTREYVSKLANVHHQFLEKYKEEILRIKNKYLSPITQFLSAFPSHENSIGLAAVKLREDETLEDETSIYKDLVSLIEHYQDKNQFARSIINHYVSTENT